MLDFRKYLAYTIMLGAVFENLVLSVHVTRVKSIFRGKYLRTAIPNRSNNADL